MKEAPYHAAAEPERFTVLGIRLLPFSIGHFFLLQRTGNAFAMVQSDGKWEFAGEPSYEHLAIAVLICCQRYEDALDSFADPRTARRMVEWEARLAGRGWLTRFGLRRPKLIDLAKQSALFREYIGDGSHIPCHRSDAQGSAPCPLVHGLWAWLTGLGFDDSTILNRGFWRSLQQYYLAKGLEGAIELQDPDVLADAVLKAQEVGDRVAQLIREGKVRL